MDFIFYIAAAIAIFSTVRVITHLNAVHALIYLVVSLLSVSVLFYMLGAPFASALEVIIYAGAIMVLFIFVVMMLHLGDKSIQLEKQWFSWSMWIGPGIMTLILFAEIIYLIFNQKIAHQGLSVVGAKQVGITLYGPYLIAVELAAVLLMAGIVGAYYLGNEKTKVLHRFLKNKEND